MRMHDPPHPGEVIREACLKPLGLTVTAVADGLGVRRKTLSDLLNGHSGVSPEMAIRLEKGRLEHRRCVAADADGARSLANTPTRRQDQGQEIRDGGDLTMRTMSITEAKQRLAALARDIESGETDVVTRNGKPIFDMVPHRKVGGLKIGAFKRKRGIRTIFTYVADDFDTPLPEDFLLRKLQL
jgi:addiction module HigA family antidote